MFGFGKGKIDIVIQKTNYVPGDIISGNVALSLKKPVQAKEVSISLIGEQWIASRQEKKGWGLSLDGTISSGRETSTNRQLVHIYDFKQQLDGEKEYTEGREYHFEMKIPADIPQMPKPEGEVGRGPKVAQVVAAVTSLTRSGPIKWYLLAKLDVPRGLDITKKVEVTIG